MVALDDTAVHSHLFTVMFDIFSVIVMVHTMNGFQYCCKITFVLDMCSAQGLTLFSSSTVFLNRDEYTKGD